MYRDHFLPILALPSITTGVIPFSATRWTTQSSWDVIALAWLGWPLSIPLQTLNCYVYPQRNLNLEIWFALAFFIHLAKENDDVTKMKFVNLWGCFFLLILP